MLKFKLLLLCFFSFTKTSQASDWLWQAASVAESYIYEYNHVITGVTAIGAAIYLLLPAAPRQAQVGYPNINPTLGEHQKERLARQGVAKISKKLQLTGPVGPQ